MVKQEWGAMLFRLLPVVWGHQHLWGPKKAGMLAKSGNSRLFHSPTRFCRTIWIQESRGNICEVGPPEARSCEAVQAANFDGIPGPGRRLEQIYYGKKVKDFRENFFLQYIFEPFRPMVLVIGRGEPQDQGKGSEYKLKNKKNRQVGKQAVDYSTYLESI